MTGTVKVLQTIVDNWQLIAQVLGGVAALLTAIATAIVSNTKLQKDAPFLLDAAHVISWASHQDAAGWIGRFKLPGMRSTPTTPPAATPPTAATGS